MADPRALVEAYATEYEYAPDTGYVRGPAAPKAFEALRAVLDWADLAELQFEPYTLGKTIADDLRNKIAAALETDHG